MRLLAELDAFRKPRKETLNPRSKFGGVLLICTVATWGLYAGYSVRAYLNTPNKITTAVLPSSTVPDNLALFSIAHSNWGQVYLLPKVRARAFDLPITRSPHVCLCLRPSCLSSARASAPPAAMTKCGTSTAPTLSSTPPHKFRASCAPSLRAQHCWASTTKTPRCVQGRREGVLLLICGFARHPAWAPPQVTIPNGAAFVYGITNASVWDIYLDPNVGLEMDYTVGNHAKQMCPTDSCCWLPFAGVIQWPDAAGRHSAVHSGHAQRVERGRVVSGGRASMFRMLRLVQCLCVQCVYVLRD